MTKLNSILTGLVAAIGFTAAASANAALYEASYADTATGPSNFQSTKSRAEVRAEAVAAQLPRFEASYEASYADTATGLSNFQSTKSRAEVRAEAVAAQLPRFEASYAAIADTVPGTSKTRAEVAAEAREALRLGLLPRSEYDIDVAM